MHETKGFCMKSETLLNLTADIVGAHLRNNDVLTRDIGNLIVSIHNTLAGLGQAAAEPEEIALKPAVSIRGSVKFDRVTCLECGFSGKMLKRHLTTAHGLTEADYRTRWTLKADHPLVSPVYSELRSEKAKTFGLGRKPGELTASDALARSRKKLGIRIEE